MATRRGARTKATPTDTPTVTPRQGSFLLQHQLFGSSGMMSKINKVIGTYNPRLVTMNCRLQMLYDPDIAFALAVLSTSIVSMPWVIKSHNPRIKAFVEAQLRPLWGPFTRAAFMAVPMGFQAFEKIWKVRDVEVEVPGAAGGEGEDFVLSNAWTIEKLKQLDPRTIDFLIDPIADEWIGLQQSTGIGGNPSNSKRQVGRENAVLWSSMKEKVFGNLSGFALLYQAYTPWWNSEAVTLFRNRYLERKGEAYFKATAPSKLTVNGEEIDGLTFMENQIFGIKNNSAVVVPSDQYQNGQPKFTIDYMQDDKRGDQFENTLMGLSVQKLRGLLIPDKSATAGDGTGSLAQAQQHGDVLVQMLAAIRQEFLTEVVQPQIIDPLVLYNFGAEEAADAETQIVAGGMSPEQQTALQGLITTIISAEQAEGSERLKLIDRIDVPGLLETMNVPMLSVEEIDKQKKARAEDAANRGASGTGLDDPDESGIEIDDRAVADGLVKSGVID